MSGGYSLDEEAFARMRRSILWTESQRSFDGGDIATSPNSPEAELWFQTADIEPAGYDGSQGFPGEVCYLGADGAPQVLQEGLAYDPNGGKLATGETYRVRFDRMETVANALVARYWVVSGTGQANEPAIEYVTPWRILTVYFTKGEYWTVDWSYPFPIYVKAVRRYFYPSSSAFGNSLDVPDCSKWKDPGDPAFLDEDYWQNYDNNLDLFLSFDMDPLPTISYSDSFLTYVDPTKLPFTELYYAFAHYAAPSRNESCGSPVLSSKFVTAPAAYILGYGGKKIPVKWNIIPGESSFWETGGSKVIAQPFTAMVKPHSSSSAWAYGISKPLPYFKKDGTQANLYFWFDDPFNLLNRSSTAYQKVLVTPIVNAGDGAMDSRGGTGMPRTKWIITQVYHQTSPNQSTASGTSGSAIGSGSVAGSGFTYTEPAAGLVNPNSFAVSSGSSSGSGGGGDFSAGTGGVE